MTERGTVSGVRLGMTMSEVVAQWGRPPKFYTKCQIGPHFAYSDVGLFFEGDVLSEIYVPADNLDVFYHSGKKLNFEQGLSAASTIYDVLRVAGEPSKHPIDTKHEREFLIYESPGHALIVAFSSESKHMSHIRLQKKGKRPVEIR